MAQPAPPSLAFEREWATLRRKLRLAKGFCFIVYFVADERLAREVKVRLRDSLGFSTSHLVEIAARTPDELVSASLAELFEAAEADVHRDVCAPYWLEAFRGRGDPAWDEARIELLMRLNERRSRLEAEVRCPLILLLPDGAQREAASRAPDMWHVRIHSTILGGTATDGAEALPAPAAVEQTLDTVLLSLPAATGLRPLPREALYWTQQLSPGGKPSLWDGFAAVDALIEQGMWQEAPTVAHGVLELARERVSDAGEAERSEAQRDLFVALNKVGDAEAAAGRGEAALAAYRESLGLRRELRSALGDAPQVLRDLFVSLLNVGDAEVAVGRDDAALTTYHESLRLARRLRAALGDAPRVLDDLSFALERIAMTSAAPMADRRAAAQEAVLLRQRLADAAADAPAYRERLGVVERLAASLDATDD